MGSSFTRNVSHSSIDTIVNLPKGGSIRFTFMCLIILRLKYSCNKSIIFVIFVLFL